MTGRRGAFSMRFAVLGFFHKSNTFSPMFADRRLFTAEGILRGEEIVAQCENSATTIGGYLTAGKRFGIQTVPLVSAFVNPAGAIAEDAFESVVGEMINGLTREGPWDGVLLNLHGAAVADKFPDADGEIAARVRQAVGLDVPVGAVLDMHANVSQRLIDALTVTLVCQTSRQTDAREKAIVCTELVARAAHGEIRPEHVLVQLPLVANIARQDTSDEPMASLVAKAAELAARPRMLSVSVVQGFPYADVPHMGMSCLAVHDGDEIEARAAAQELATAVWRQRARLQARELSIDEALDIAEYERAGPVVLQDVGDNVGAGAPGDSTVILEAAVRRGFRSLTQTLCDPEAVRFCATAGVGAEVALRVGACYRHSPGSPVPIKGLVRVISDGKFEEQNEPHGGLRFFDMGDSAVVDTADGHTIVLTSKVIINAGAQQFYSVGVDPADYHAVVVKDLDAPRAAFGPIASRVIVVDTDGVTAMDLGKLIYLWRRRPMYPFERSAFEIGSQA